MAEFIDVIHTIQRFCKRHNGQCPTCILSTFACPNNARFDKTDEAMFRELEDFVVKWEEAHPEPVYPTWWEWLEDMGIVGKVKSEYSEIFDTICVETKMFNPIPADIAEKLGLKPKEGKQ